MDEEDKVRRNVVIASAIVLLCAFLKVSIPALVARIGTSYSTPPLVLEPIRLWAATVVILLYLVLRFRFSKHTAEARSEMKVEWEAIKSDYARSTIHLHLRRLNAKGTNSKLFASDLSAVAEAERRETQLQFAQLGRVYGLPTLQAASVTMTGNLVGKVSMGMVWFGEAGEVMHAKSAQVEEFAFNGSERRKLIAGGRRPPGGEGLHHQGARGRHPDRGAG